MADQQSIGQRGNDAHGLRREVQSELAEWELIKPGHWVRKLRDWNVP